jgi:hypothetical protein
MLEKSYSMLHYVQAIISLGNAIVIMSVIKCSAQSFSQTASLEHQRPERNRNE